MQRLAVWMLALGILAGLATGAVALREYPGSDDDYGPDYLHIRTTDGAVVAIRNRRPPLTVNLAVNEQVLAVRTEGRIGAVLTDQRFLAVSIRSPQWVEQGLEIKEGFRGELRLSQEIALLVTPQRAVVFELESSAMAAYDLPLGEVPVALEAGSKAAAFATATRTVVFDRGSGNFRELEFEVGEDFRSLRVGAGVVSLETSKRLLTFRASSGRWTARPLSPLE